MYETNQKLNYVCEAAVDTFNVPLSETNLNEIINIARDAYDCYGIELSILTFKGRSPMNSFNNFHKEEKVFKDIIVDEYETPYIFLEGPVDLDKLNNYLSKFKNIFEENNSEIKIDQVVSSQRLSFRGGMVRFQ